MCIPLEISRSVYILNLPKVIVYINGLHGTWWYQRNIFIFCSKATKSEGFIALSSSWLFHYDFVPADVLFKYT